MMLQLKADSGSQEKTSLLQEKEAKGPTKRSAREQTAEAPTSEHQSKGTVESVPNSNLAFLGGLLALGRQRIAQLSF